MTAFLSVLATAALFAVVGLMARGGAHCTAGGTCGGSEGGRDAGPRCGACPHTETESHHV